MPKDSFFTRHLREADESYFHHLCFTLQTGATLIVAGCAIVIHGLMPFILVDATTGLVDRLHDKLVKRRRARNSSHS